MVLTPSSPFPVLVWFREDLRVSNHLALTAAVATGRPVACVYIRDSKPHKNRPLGSASKWWLHGSLKTLDENLKALGASLYLFEGDEEETIQTIAAHINPAHIVWHRRYAKAHIEIDMRLKTTLREQGMTVESFNGHLLYEPWEVVSKTGTPLKVFTPFWRAARASKAPALPLPSPSAINGYAWPHTCALQPVSLDHLALEPTSPDWSGGMRSMWPRDEAGAQERLDAFLSDGLNFYADERDRPDKDHTSRLSPYLAFGNISPRQIWHRTLSACASGECTASDRNVEKFFSELGWREFSYHLLFQFPELPRKNFQARFDAFPWVENPATYSQWCKGQTGYPIVDAGMRQLWTTGWMHNRVRMICASFLIKHLMLDWREGENWFWDTLVDADIANNAASWQWVAGSGADAAPYFRIFNPVLQAQKFDPEGDYIRQWCPEIANLPTQYIHAPWMAPAIVLQRAGIKLGEHYPKPIVDHDVARARALEAFEVLKG
jgi:deoxyribodipyrimidine photo-lyase